MKILEYKRWLFRIKKRNSLKLAAATGIFRNSKGEILFLQPTYRDGMQLPGGFCDGGESPEQALVREIQEEMGLVVDPGNLKHVDHVHDVLVFVYDCGQLSDSQIKKIALDPGEILSMDFVPADKLDQSDINPLVVARVKKSI